MNEEKIVFEEEQVALEEATTLVEEQPAFEEAVAVPSKFSQIWSKVFKKRKKPFNTRTKGEKIAHGIIFVALTIHFATWIIPWIWTILSSLKTDADFMYNNGFELPTEWKFSNYVDAITKLKVGDVTFVEMIWNSVWYVFLNMFLDTFVPACTAYCMAKYDFKGRNFIYSVAIGCMTIPIYGGMASHMKLHMMLGSYDNPLYVVFTSMGGFGGSFLMYYGYFKNLPWSYAEAVMMDGGGPYTIFIKIMIPMAMPMVSVFAITGAMGSWNDYMSFVTWMPSWPNLATGMYNFQQQQVRSYEWPLYYAGSIVTMLVPIAIFCTFQKKILTGMTFGGLKG